MANKLKEKGLLVSRPTVARVLNKNGRTRKKITLHYRELKISKVKQFGQIIHDLPLNKFSAIDECHFYLNEAPRYGYAPKGQRTISPTPGSKGGSYSLIIWVKNEKSKGVVNWELTDKTINTQFFHDFIEKTKSLGDKEDYLIMDNVSFHRAPNKRKKLGLPSIEEQLSLKNSKLFSLPTHSPQLNPVELIFNNIRHNIEKSRSWTPEQLRETIGKEMAKLNNEDLNKYFQKSLEYNLVKLIIDSVKIVTWEKRQLLRKMVTKIGKLNIHPEINKVSNELLSTIDEIDSIYGNMDI